MHLRLRTLLIVSALGPPILASCANTATESTSAATPADVFETYREARSKRDWRRCFSILTPEAQDGAVFEAYFSSAESGSPEAAAVCKRYVNEGTLKSETEKERQKNAADNTSFDLRAVLPKAVADKAGFYAAITDIFINEGDPPPPLGELLNLKVDGDVAHGHASTTQWHLKYSNGVETKVVDEVESSFTFKRIDGQWLIASH